MGSGSVHTKEAAFCDMGAKVLYAFYIKCRHADCFDFDLHTVLINTAIYAVTGDTSNHVNVCDWCPVNTNRLNLHLL